MRRVSAADVVRNFSEACDDALLQPIVVTRNGRDRLVLTNVDNFRRLVTLAIAAAATSDEADRLGAILKVIA